MATAPPQTRNRRPKQQPSKTAIQKVLRSATFDPRESGPLRIIADVGDPAYYVARAKEFLATLNPNFGNPALTVARHDAGLNIRSAISLLALALVDLEGN